MKTPITLNEDNPQIIDQQTATKKQWIKPEMAVLIINLDSGPVNDMMGAEAS